MAEGNYSELVFSKISLKSDKISRMRLLKTIKEGYRIKLEILSIFVLKEVSIV